MANAEIIFIAVFQSLLVCIVLSLLRVTQEQQYRIVFPGWILRRLIQGRIGVTLRTVYGENAENALRSQLSKAALTSSLFLMFFLVLSVWLNYWGLVLFGLLGGGGLAYYFYASVAEISKAREQSILRTFPEVLSKLGLLIGAGMTTREAWKKTAFSGRDGLYCEMQKAVLETESGRPEKEVYTRMVAGCGVPEVERFIGAFVQNLAKGSSEMASFLKQAATESWQNRKIMVRIQGERASTRLVFPILLMFIGIFGIVMIPIFGSIKSMNF